tara:strand:+ start:658 stop:1104 length:447 start_codon:yes stop_codon:yes gene_type:complete
MTVKTESNFWKTLKKLWESGDEKYLVSRIESYVTPGFPDCVVFHKDTGFFTLELKVVKRNKRGIGRCHISTLQHAWNVSYARAGAPVYILVYDLGRRVVNLFHGSKTPKLRDNDLDSMVGEALYSGPLPGLQLHKLLNSQTPQFSEKE